MKKLDLEQRGNLLVLFPLICQILFAIILTTQLWNIHSTINKQSQSCQLITKTISLIAYSINLGYINQMGAEHGHIAGVTAEKKMFDILDDKLHQITARSEPDEAQRSRIAVLAETGETLIGSLNSLRDHQNKGWQYWKHVHSAFEINLVSACGQMLDAADSVVEYEEAKRHGSELATNSQLQNLNSFLTGAIGVTIAAALIMAAFYIRDILIPLKHLSANCLRISRQEDLLTVMHDGSEFSLLDEILHAIQKATKEEQEKENSMVENTNDLICSLSNAGLFLRANKSAQTFFGVDPQAIVGRSVFDFIAEEDRALAEKSLEEACAGGESKAFEFKIKQKDLPVHTRWSCLYSLESGELFAVVHNIEKEKIVENLKQDFVDMVSHDLRSPLSSMQVALDMVALEGYGEISKEALNEVSGARRNLGRLLDFVNDLLDFQKLKHGKLQLECDNAYVEELVQTAIDYVKPALQAKDIKIELNGKDILLFADPKKMVQLLTNLLANAIHYTPRQGEIKVDWKESGSEIEISVTDSGKGIAEEHRQRIFEAFEQTPETVGKAEGSGLGLAICKLIADAHKGTISVDSAVGNGSKFTVKIPLPQA